MWPCVCIFVKMPFFWAPIWLIAGTNDKNGYYSRNRKVERDSSTYIIIRMCHQTKKESNSHSLDVNTLTCITIYSIIQVYQEHRKLFFVNVFLCCCCLVIFSHNHSKTFYFSSFTFYDKSTCAESAQKLDKRTFKGQFRLVKVGFCRKIISIV